jgi:hypothetical protein
MEVLEPSRCSSAIDSFSNQPVTSKAWTVMPPLPTSKGVMLNLILLVILVLNGMFLWHRILVFNSGTLRQRS